MAEINDWETDPANNSLAPPDGAPEGMLFADVNDTLRETMAVEKRVHTDNSGSLTAVGSGSKVTITPARSIPLLYDGLTFRFVLSGAATASNINLTIAVSGVSGTFSLLNQDGSDTTWSTLPDACLCEVTYHSGAFYLDSVLKKTLAQTEKIPGYHAVEIIQSDISIDVDNFNVAVLFFDGVGQDKLIAVESMLHVEVQPGDLRIIMTHNFNSPLFAGKFSVAYDNATNDPEDSVPANYGYYEAPPPSIANYDEMWLTYDAGKISRVVHFHGVFDSGDVSNTGPVLLARQNVETPGTPSIIKKGSWIKMSSL